MGANTDLRGRAARGAAAVRRSATAAYADLLGMGPRVMQTREAAARLGMSISAASRLLSRLEHSGLVRRLRRGLWALSPDIDPFTLPPYLTAPFPAYVSFWSALARHDMIEQVPRRIYVASLARTRRITTSDGDYSIHHVAPEVFGGYREVDGRGQLATPEKALFDTAYLLAPRGGKVYLPELRLPKGFAQAETRYWTNRIRDRRIRTLVGKRLKSTLAGARRQEQST